MELRGILISMFISAMDACSQVSIWCLPASVAKSHTPGGGRFCGFRLLSYRLFSENPVSAHVIPSLDFGLVRLPLF